MYSYEDRMRAIGLYIQYDRSSATVIRELGYPSRKALYRWYQEFEQAGDLPGGYRKRHKYSAKRKEIAVEYLRWTPLEMATSFDHLGAI